MAKILFFAPHAGIWEHAFPEALVAESIGQSAHKIRYVTCDGLFQEYCVVMASAGLQPGSPVEARERVCRACRRNRETLREGFKFESIDLSGMLALEDQVEIEHVLSSVTRDNFTALEIDGVAIGRLAAYEFLLHHKKSDLHFSEHEWKHYLICLKASLGSFFSSRKILSREQPDFIVVYNAMYSVNAVCVALAKQRGITPYFLHAGINYAHMLETLFFGKGVTFDFLKDLRRHWERYRDVPCDAKSIARVADHFLVLLRGHSVFAYSAPKAKAQLSVRERFKVAQSQKLLVATLCSYDERFAAEVSGHLPEYNKLLFSTQIEWVHALIDECKRRPDWYLLIRVHPREFPNKREQVKSEHARRLEAILRDLPENVAINWPTDQISIYDLAEEADVFLNSWSSAGKEMALLGIPVVLYSSELPLYPPDLNYVGETRADYFRKIDQALADGWSAERIRRAFRWYVLEHVRSVLNISESFKKKDFTPSGWGSRILAKIDRILRPNRKQRSDCQSRAAVLRCKDVINSMLETGASMPLDAHEPRDAEVVGLDQETAALKAELGRICRALYGDLSTLAGSSRLRDRLTAFIEH